MGHHRNRRLTVGQCRIFDVACLKQGLKCVDFPTNRGDIVWAGTTVWPDPFGGIEAVLCYLVGRTGEGLTVLLDPERTSPFPASARLPGEYTIPITTTRPHAGGFRYWFGCPAQPEGKACGRRVKKLYLPSDQQVFGCRQCYDLTYRSVQTHDQRKYDLAQNPEALGAALGSKDLRRAFLGIQALPLHVRQMQKHGW